MGCRWVQSRVDRINTAPYSSGFTFPRANEFLDESGVSEVILEISLVSQWM